MAHVQLRRLDLPSLVLDGQLDEALTALRAGGLALTGAAGLGKSGLAAQLLRRLHDEGWAAALHAGRWLPQQFFWSAAEALQIAADFPGRIEAFDVLAADVPEKTKLETLLDLLARAPVVLLFDDLGVNLTQDGTRFVDPG